MGGWVCLFKAERPFCSFGFVPSLAACRVWGRSFETLTVAVAWHRFLTFCWRSRSWLWLQLHGSWGFCCLRAFPRFPYFPFPLSHIPSQPLLSFPFLSLCSCPAGAPAQRSRPCGRNMCVLSRNFLLFPLLFVSCCRCSCFSRHPLSLSLWFAVAKMVALESSSKGDEVCVGVWVCSSVFLV